MFPFLRYLERFSPTSPASVVSIFQKNDSELNISEEEQRCVEDLKKEVEKVRQQHIKSKNSYTDEEFVEYNDPPSVDRKFKKYVRACESNEGKREDGNKLTVYGDEIDYRDAHQHKFGDCWLMASITLLAARPHLLKRIIITDEYNEQGVYGLRLFVNGAWIGIIIDDLLPIFSNGDLVGCAPKKKKLWATLLEKAVAKVVGGYSRIHGGKITEGLKLLTGYCTQHIYLDKVTKDELFDIIWREIESGSLMGFSSKKKGPRTRPENPLGVSAKHAHPLLAAYKCLDYKLLCIRNVWGRDKFRGRWTDPEVVKHILPESFWPEQGFGDVTKGTFWIDMDELYDYFVYFNISYVREGWNSSQLGLMFPRPTIPNFYVAKLITDEYTRVHLNIAQQKATRLNTGDFEGLMVVFNESYRIIYCSLCDPINYVGWFTTLPPGTIHIACFAFSQWEKIEAQTYVVVCDSDKPVCMEELMEPQRVVANVMIRLAMTKGQVNWVPDTGGLMSTYIYKSKGICIMATAAVNRSQRKLLEANCNFLLPKCSITRKQASTRDVIEAGKGQLLNIAAPLVHSATYGDVQAAIVATVPRARIQRNSIPPVSTVIHLPIPVGDFLPTRVGNN